MTYLTGKDAKNFINWTKIYKDAGVELPIIEDNKLYLLYPDGIKVFVKDIPKHHFTTVFSEKKWRINLDGKFVEKI